MASFSKKYQSTKELHGNRPPIEKSQFIHVLLYEEVESAFKRQFDCKDRTIGLEITL